MSLYNFRMFALISVFFVMLPQNVLACVERPKDNRPHWFIGFHQGAFERMTVERGVPADSYWPVSLDDIQNTLKLTPQNEVLLLYAEDQYNTGTICLVVIDETGLRARADTGLRPETFSFANETNVGETSKEVFRLHAELGVVSRQASRAGVPIYQRKSFEKMNAVNHTGQDREALLSLSEALIPVAVEPTLVDADEILILPVFGVATVPFPLLKIGERSLIDIAPVTVVPAITSFVENLDGQTVPPPMYYSDGWIAPAIFGDPKSAPTEEWRFPPLPGARAEAWAVATVLRRKPIVGEAATKAAVLEALAGDTDFFYLASHGISNSKNPLEGFLALADGQLSAYEIQRLELRSPALVVLSACQTGLGQSHQAGIIGVSRGFILAGAGAVVMSLWNVDDVATAQLMRRFAARVGKERPSRALRHAMLDMREIFPEDPALWAGFVVLGNVSIDASGR